MLFWDMQVNTNYTVVLPHLYSIVGFYSWSKRISWNTAYLILFHFRRHEYKVVPMEKHEHSVRVIKNASGGGQRRRHHPEDFTQSLKPSQRNHPFGSGMF